MRQAPRILAVTAGPAHKRNAITAALADLYGAEILPGKARPERRRDRVLAWLGLGAMAMNLRSLNAAILARAGQFDILFVVKGNFVTAETLQALRALPRPPKIVYWTCDDIHLPHNSSPVLRAAARHCDIIYTAKSLNISQGELTGMGFKRAEFLFQGFDRDIHRPLPVAGSRFAGKVVFVGYGEADRFNQMNHLAQNGIEVDVWGNGWTGRLTRGGHANLHLHRKPIFDDDYAEALCNAGINLCFLRKMNRDLHSSRSFEIPACGGFMLAERTCEHLSLFVENQEAVFFRSPDELLTKTRYYLDHPKARAKIAAAGYRRTRASDYSFHRLAGELIEQVQADLGGPP